MMKLFSYDQKNIIRKENLIKIIAMRKQPQRKSF